MWESDPVFNIVGYTVAMYNADGLLHEEDCATKEDVKRLIARLMNPEITCYAIRPRTSD